MTERFPMPQDAAKNEEREEALSEMPETIQMTRQQLYDEIWTISVAGMAKKYGISYGQLMKQVKAAEIPVPPSGYWTKLSFGKPVEKTALTGDTEAAVVLLIAVPAAPKSTQSAEIPRGAEDLAVREAAPVETQADTQPETAEQDAPAEAQPAHETVHQCGQTYNVYDRETLYREVWEAPVTEVAKRYQVSDVAIHKVCKSLEIPTPPAGYWAKLRAGKPARREPLPQSDKAQKKTGVCTGTVHTVEVGKETLAFLDAEERSVIMTVASQIMLPDENSRMHTKITAHRKTLVAWKKQQDSSKSRAWGRRTSEAPPYLATGISEETLPRVCRILDALIKAMEPLGCRLTEDLAFVVNEETVRLNFSEAQDKILHVVTKEENLQLLKYEEDRKRYSWASKPQIRKYDYVFNGRISVNVDGWRSFRDCRSYQLEERLGDLMVTMYEASEEHRQARLDREEAERKRQEEQRRKEEFRKQYNAEVDRTQALVNLAEDYETACKIRSYIAAVEAARPPSAETAEWLAWAKAKADWYDPMVAAKDTYFGKREHEKSYDDKKLKYRGYGW